MFNKKERQNSDLNDLNDMQRYLGEETYDDYKEGQLSRRRMLRRLLYICGSSSAVVALLAACGDSLSTSASGTISSPATSTTSLTNAGTTSAPTATITNNASAKSTAGSTTGATEPSTTAAGTSGTSGTGTTAAAAPGPMPTSAPAKGPLTIPENDPELTATEVTFQGDTTITGYMVKPKVAGTYPAIIIIHENRGLTDHIKDVARRIAKAGYIALAPDLVSRFGGTSKFSQDQIAGMLGQAKPEELVKDLNSAEGFLEKQQGVNSTKIGVVGFCFGGGYTLRLAGANPKIVAAVSYYGPVPQPVTLVTSTNAAILGQYGALDQRVNAGIPDLEKAMKDAGKTYQKNIYDGANHAFNNDTGASYNEAAAVAAFKSTLDWFGKYLKA